MATWRRHQPEAMIWTPHELLVRINTTEAGSKRVHNNREIQEASLLTKDNWLERSNQITDWDHFLKYKRPFPHRISISKSTIGSVSQFDQACFMPALVANMRSWDNTIIRVHINMIVYMYNIQITQRWILWGHLGLSLPNSSVPYWFNKNLEYETKV